MKVSNFELIKGGLLTVPMDPKSKGFASLKEFLDGKVNDLTQEQRYAIELQGVRVSMNEYLNAEITRKELIKSGTFLKDLLNRLNIKQNRFAEYLGMKPSNLSKLLNGDRKISFEVSLILEQIFNIESNLWLSIQSKNRFVRMSKRELQRFRKFKLKDLLSNQQKSVG